MRKLIYWLLFFLAALQFPIYGIGYYGLDNDAYEFLKRHGSGWYRDFFMFVVHPVFAEIHYILLFLYYFIFIVKNKFKYNRALMMLLMIFNIRFVIVAVWCEENYNMFSFEAFILVLYIIYYNFSIIVLEFARRFRPAIDDVEKLRVDRETLSGR